MHAQKKKIVWDDFHQRWVEQDQQDDLSSGRVKVCVFEPSSDDETRAAWLAKARDEIRAREAETKRKLDGVGGESALRSMLEPKVRSWSDEPDGTKKPLRVLLATLHTVLWPGANWKQVDIDDLLDERDDDRKVRRFFYKATRVVHPDKTHHLDAENRVLAVRIFDVLCEAKQELQRHIDRSN